MKVFKADLHLHTVLSPCGDLLMTPQSIIDYALEVGLDMIAITDHNSAENVEVAMKLAQATSLSIIPGMEVETVEEVHLLCFFGSLMRVLDWQEIVYDALPQRKNNEELFGPQLVTDENDQYVRRVDRLLATATNLSINDVVEKVSQLGGVVIPSHIDKANYSIIANLGFIPSDLKFVALEVNNTKRIERIKEDYNLGEYTIISNSDAHYLEDIRVSSKFIMKGESITEFKQALMGMNGRKVLIF